MRSSLSTHRSRTSVVRATLGQLAGPGVNVVEASPSRFADKSGVLSVAEKIAAYEDAIGQLDALLAGESHPILKMATINCVLREALPYYFCVPVRDQAGELIAVFDVDSTGPGSFDGVDEAFLSQIVGQHFGR
jgi:putative methionine-R-sulfoxide reductase with GAF domain